MSLRYRVLLLILFMHTGLFSFSAGRTGLYEPDVQGMQYYFLVKPEKAGEPGFSGDRQHGETGGMVDPLRARVIDQRSEPVIGIPVIFEVVDYPSGGGDYRIDRRMVPTDSSGMAVVNFRLGTAEGEYRVIARIRSGADVNVQHYNLFARGDDWLLFLGVGIAGGLALFLMGLFMMSRGMLQLAGDKMRAITGGRAGNRFKAMGLGAFITTVNQSNHSTNLMLGSFANAGLMRFRQTPAIILGTAIGTTITAQLIAFRLTGFSLLFVALGFLLHAFAGKEQFRNTGDFLLGFGLLFFGMHVLSETIYPLRSYDPFIRLLLRLEDPLHGILAGTLLTAVVRNSSVLVGIMIILGMQGVITLEASIPLLLGAGMGTAVAALVNSIKTGVEARKVALTITLIKFTGVLIFYWFIEPFTGIVRVVSPGEAGETYNMAVMAELMPRQIANAHTLYNVVTALLILPLTGLIARLMEWLIPARVKTGKTALNSHYLDESMLKNPAVALNLAKNEVERTGRMVQGMVDSILPVSVKGVEGLEVNEGDEDAPGDIRVKQEKVNFLCITISIYVIKINRERLRRERVIESLQIIYTVRGLDHIAGAVSSFLPGKTGILRKEDFSLSEEDKRKLVKYHEITCRQISLAMEVFSGIALEKASEVKQKYEKYLALASEQEKQHYELLKQGDAGTIPDSKTQCEMLTMMREISFHATDILRKLMLSDTPRGKKGSKFANFTLLG